MLATELIPKRDCPKACKNPLIAGKWGCKPKTKSEFPFTVDTDDGGTEKIWRCPYAILRQTDVWQVMFYFRLYRKEILPVAGGSLEQPMKLMEALDFLDCNLPDYQKRAEDKEESFKKMQEKMQAKQQGK